MFDEDRNPKFIVTKDLSPSEGVSPYDVTLAYCSLHKDLHSKHAKSESKVVGGGWWEMFRDETPQRLLMYSQSYDFGFSNVEHIKEALKDGIFSWRFSDFDIYFSEETDLEKALDNNTKIFDSTTKKIL